MFTIVFNFGDLKFQVVADSTNAAFHKPHNHFEFQGIYADASSSPLGELRLHQQS